MKEQVRLSSCRNTLWIQFPVDYVLSGTEVLRLPFFSLQLVWDTREKNLKKTFASNEVFRQRYWSMKGTTRRGWGIATFQIGIFLLPWTEKMKDGERYKTKELKTVGNMMRGRMQTWGERGTLTMC